MTTEAQIGYGGSFAIQQTGDASPVVVAEVTNITPPSDQVDILDATNMASPDATREFIIGLRDPGECTLEMNFVPGGAGDTKIQAVRTARVPVTCVVTFPAIAPADAVTWPFTGTLTGYEPDMPVDDKMTAAVTWKVTGSYVTGTV